MPEEPIGRQEHGTEHNARSVVEIGQSNTGPRIELRGSLFLQPTSAHNGRADLSFVWCSIRITLITLAARRQYLRYLMWEA